MCMKECLKTRNNCKLPKKISFIFKSSSNDTPFKSRLSNLGREGCTSGAGVARLTKLLISAKLKELRVLGIVLMERTVNFM